VSPPARSVAANLIPRFKESRPRCCSAVCRKKSLAIAPPAPVLERAPTIMQENLIYSMSLKSVAYRLPMPILNPEQTAYLDSEILFGCRATPIRCVLQPNMEV
jgi:hypothetical protein